MASIPFGRRRDVIIIGGGPAGSFTALHLASLRPGLAERTVLLEARPQGRRKVCAGGVSGRVMCTALRDLGVDIRSVPGRDVDGIVIRFRDRVSTTNADGLARVIRRELLDSFLLDRVREAGVEVLTETPATGLTRTERGISVETRDGTWEAAVLIGADGMHGVTKKALGVGPGRHLEYLLMVDLPGVEVPPKLTLDYTPIDSGTPGYAWFFPEDNGANGGITGGAPGGMVRLREQFLDSARRNLGEDLDERALRFRPYPERFFSFYTPSRSERVLYVGDKLGVTPMTGEGIGVCLSSAKVAAGETVRALERGDYSFRSYPVRLAACDFVPTWALEQAFLRWKTPRLFDLFMTLATEENRPGNRSFFADYCRIFSGERRAWSPRSLVTLLKVLPSASLLARWLK